MVTSSSNSGGNWPPASSARFDRMPTASLSSSSSPPVFTPSSTPFTFGEQRASSPSFTFGSETAPNPVRPTPNNTTPERSSLTPSSISTYSLGDNHDPDTPLPSVETDVSISSRQSTPDTTLYTPSTSTQADRARQVVGGADVLQQISDLRSLRLSSPRTAESPSLQRDTPTPSIRVTPSARPSTSSQPRGSRTDSLVDGISALRVESPAVNSPSAPGLQESRSLSPSRRRRSGSGINRDIHQIENEEPPQALFHKPEVQEALATARTLTARMTAVLSSSSLHREAGSKVEGLYQQATRLNNFTLPSSRIVGLVGDSGVGKSSLINSLLDKTELARASSSGTACTCAVTEYLFHDRDDFIIHVDYFPLDELKKQFEELLEAYREYQSLSEDSKQKQQKDNRRDKTEAKRLQEKADLAAETFKASFKEKLEQTPNILSSMPFERAVATLVEWASQILPRHGGKESYSTLEGCSSRLRQLTSEMDDSLPRDGAGTCWPFIQKLRVYLNAYILSKGLIIADLPGLRDLNSARKAITERYVRQCHQILVVATIDRAITNESIRDIFELAKHANLSKIDVICTRSEDIHFRESRHDWSAERTIMQETQKEVDAIAEEIKLLKEEMEDYDEDNANLTREEEQHLMKLHRECRKAEKSKENHEFELLRRIIKLRNDKVSNGLRKAYRNHPVAAMLKIFCVSNKLYWENREKPALAAMPYLKLSGILELRSYCIGIVAESRLRATSKFIKDEIPASLGSVELWVEAGSGNVNAERKQQILKAVSIIQGELDQLISPISPLNEISHTLGEEFNRQIFLRMQQNGRQWSADARQASYAWQGWLHPTYKAFCSNYGEHRTEAVGYHCWNRQAIEGMNDDMSTVWDSFAADLEVHLEQINGAVLQAFEKVTRVVLSTLTALTRGEIQHGAAKTARSAMRTFALTLRHRKDIIIYGIEKASGSFQSELVSLHTDAFSSIRTAFIGMLMESTYHAANMDFGSGSDRRRKDLITGRFGSLSFFSDHRRDCKDKFREIALELQDKVSEIVNQQVALIEADLQMLGDENAILESERDPEFRARVSVEVETVEKEVERIKGVFEDTS